MQQLETQGVDKDITKIWNKLGPEGEGEELKLAAYHCLLGVQETLSHPNDYIWLEKFSLAFSKHPHYKEFALFRSEMETGKYQIHFTIDKMREKNGKRSVHLVTTVERIDRKSISSETRSNIEKWAALIGMDILEKDIQRILKLEHAEI